jgi:hypothetical protein
MEKKQPCVKWEKFSPSGEKSVHDVALSTQSHLTARLKKVCRYKFTARIESYRTIFNCVNVQKFIAL